MGERVKGGEGSGVGGEVERIKGGWVGTQHYQRGRQIQESLRHTCSKLIGSALETGDDEAGPSNGAEASARCPR